MTREYLLSSPFYKQKFKDIYKLLFTADLDEINDHSNWYLKEQGYVEKNTPLWIIVESKILNKRMWITKTYGELEITTAQLDLPCNSKEYHDSYRRAKFKNQKEMAEFLENLLQPCLEIDYSEENER